MEPDKKPFSLASDESCLNSCSVRLLWLTFILLSVSGWTRMVDTMIHWYWFEFAGVMPGALYMAITGGLWGLVGLFAAFWILRERAWGRLVGIAAVLFYVFAYWIDRLFFAQAPGVGSNTTFALLVTFVVVLASVLILRPLPALMRLARRRERDDLSRRQG